ncbi:hypothetical protein SO802_028947 [Lithocarpus litseifolius]|uniref:Uncharacterized protein n=1 Tax=Lithocarpus litseifolius TaxID=425828 RepID=A0AAW2BT88_9ROSI
MKGLRFDGPLIDLEGESGIQLGIDFLGCRNLSESIRYFDLEAVYRSCFQAMLDEYAWMAKAFLLYLLGGYLFANGGQTVSLRWFAFFRDFGYAWERWALNYGCRCLVVVDHLLRRCSCASLKGELMSSDVVKDEGEGPLVCVIELRQF